MKAFQLYSKIDQNISPAALKLLLRNIAVISPDLSNGQIVKNKVIKKIEEYLSSQKDDNVKSLRNLPLSAFANGEKIVSELIRIFINKAFQDISSFNTDQLAELCILSNTETRKNWWHTVVESTFRQVVEIGDSPEVKNIWKILIYSETSSLSMLSFIPIHSDIETLFIKYIPEFVPSDIAEILAVEIQKRNWLRLHARLLLKFKIAKTAVVEQAALEEAHSSTFFEGTNFILKELPNNDLLLIVSEEGKDIFIQEYADRTVSNPGLLSKLDVGISVWVKIWQASLKCTNDLFHGVQNLPDKIEQIVTLIADGITIPDIIIRLIAQSEFADISAYTNRDKIWNNLPVEYKPYFLEATANKYILRIISGTDEGTDIEPELYTYMSSDSFMTVFLSRHRNDINAVLSVYEQIDHLQDRFLSDYIGYYSGSINDLQSSRLGNLIMSKHFSVSAQKVFEKAKYNEKFKFALTNCKALLNLGFIDRIFFSNLLEEVVTTDSAYSALLEIAITLYEQGPDDRHIWKRAGGDISKLSGSRTREESWKEAVYLLKHGGGGRNISPKSLIKEMLEDFPKNNQLKEILKHFSK